MNIQEKKTLIADLKEKDKNRIEHEKLDKEIEELKSKNNKIYKLKRGAINIFKKLKKLKK
jgi:hypothetical protein